MAKYHKLPVFTQQAAAEQGFKELCTTSLGDHTLWVFERPHPELAAWQYWVASIDKDSQWRLLNRDEPLQSSPGVGDFSDLLRESGMTRKQRFDFGHEWAINVNLSNDYPSNFSCKELCDRAMDELLLDGYLNKDDDSVCVFEIDPQGNKTDSSDIDVGEWFNKRVDSVFVASPRLLLAAAVTVGSSEHVQKALMQGANGDLKIEQDGRTVLHAAASLGREEVVSMLLQKGAQPDARDWIGCRPVHEAASNGHARIIHLLHEAGADVQAQDDHGRTPLSMATNNEEARTLLRSLIARKMCERTLVDLETEPARPHP